MSAYFCDSSAIVKRYVTEIGSAWVVSITAPVVGNDIHLVRITGVEVVSAITRVSRSGRISVAEAANSISDFRSDFANQYQIVEVTHGLLNRAMTLAETHALRGYDAVQLAAALEVNAHYIGRGEPPVTLVSADVELNTAAAAEGLAVDDPNAHP
jgi:uncharacterized protein